MYRLALDLGTNSLGWCVFSLSDDLRPESISRMGVRIFSDGRDPKSGASLAVERRMARQARRRRDRLLGRKNALMGALVEFGLMPRAQEERKRLERLDPYRIRAEGLEKKLSLYELGRALFHINQRRGFKSNRKTDKSNEDGKIVSGIQRLRERLAAANARTLGEYLYTCKQKGNPTRVRSEGSGTQLSYPFYPDRSLLEQEFDALWQAQSRYHNNLTTQQGEGLRDIIFYQRPLRPVEPGRCSLEPTLPRAPLALPLAQRVRILQTLSHLRVVTADLQERPLTLAERNAALASLEQGKNKHLTFNQFRKLLGVDATHTFNLENPSEEKITGDATANILSREDLFGASWFALSLDEQNSVAGQLLEEEDADALQAGLMHTYGLNREAAEKAAQAKLPEGYASHCREVLEKLRQAMEEEVISYAEAREKIGYPYKDPTGEILPYLPYYGRVLERYVGKTGEAKESLEKRYGRIANPTVHVALNQLRRVVNELIRELGLPAQVVVEVARDLKNGLKAKEDIRKRQNAERKKNDIRRAKLLEQGIAVTPDSLLRMRLWEELADDAAARCCVYTGEPLSFARLFSDDVEIEHILPFSRTLDNSPANKTIALRRANRDKGNSSPFEAFHDKSGYSWEGILNRAASMQDNKRWRFAEDAMERFEKDGAFLTRQLNDTQYIARVAREYLCSICPPGDVWVTPGKLTGNLAAAWEFPRKNRNSHTHHARDAALIGVTDRALLQRAARHHAAGGTEALNRLLTGFPEPWPHFTSHVLHQLTTIVVSHKVDHGIAGELHDAQPFGILAPNGQPRNAQQRRPVGVFTKPEHLLDIKEIKLAVELLRSITGKPHHECLAALRAASETTPKKAKEAIRNFVQIDDNVFMERFAAVARERGIRGIRTVEKKTLIPIKNKQQTIYKGLHSSSNAWYDIYEDEKGKWTHEVVSTFDAHRKGTEDTAPAAEGRAHVMRLFKNDMVELEEDGAKRYYYVLKFKTNGQIYLVAHDEANADKRSRDKDKRNRDKDDELTLSSRKASRLRQLKAKAVYVSPAGTIIYKERPCHVAARRGNKRE